MKLLVIEDNPRLAQKMQQQLQKWFLVEIAPSGDEGLRSLATSPFDCVLLDLGLPDEPGATICRRIRALDAQVPILIVTGIDTTDSRITLLNDGADDYLTKPFDIHELHARINALIRRQARSASKPLLHIADLTIDVASRHVSRSGQQIRLRKKEFDILECLVRNAGHVVSRQMLINHAWTATSKGWVGSVDVHIKQLRDKVDKPFSFPLIKTSYGIGYIIELPSPAPTHARKDSL